MDPFEQQRQPVQPDQDAEKTATIPFPMIVGAVAVVLLAIAAAIFFAPSDEPETRAGDFELTPEIHGRVPGTPLFTNHRNEAVALRDLAGEPWIAAFIFTRCKGACPIIVRSMMRLEAQLDSAGITTRLVAFTVDPSFDTPEVLGVFADSLGASSSWTFLSAPDSVVQPLAIDAFRLAIEEGIDPDEPIIHSSRLILVDRSLWIRGYFDVRSPDALDQLLEARRELNSPGDE